MRAWLIRSAIVLAVAGSAAGLGLAAAGVHSPVRTALVLLFLAVGPTAAVAGLLRGFPPFARVVIAGTADIIGIAVIAIIMLSVGLWSPTGGLMAVAGVTVACLVAQVPPARLGSRAGKHAPAQKPDRGGPREPAGGAGRETAPSAGQALPEEAAAQTVTADPGHRHR
jgi:hypothetical protein